MSDATDSPMTDDAAPEPVVLDLDALEAAARAASPGLWEAAGDYDGFTFVTIHGVAKAEVLASNRLRDEDAAHIAAARPEVVLALIERLRAADRPSTPKVGLYRNHLGKELHVTGGWPDRSLGDIGEAEARDPLFGTRRYFVTERSLRDCGYEFIGESA